MTTQLATQQIRLSQWMDIVRSRSESGLTVKDFCRQHEISETAYYYWLRKIRAAAIQEQAPQFVELTAPAETIDDANDTAGVIIELNGAKIHVSNTGCRNTLSMVLEVLRHAQ